MQLNQRAIGATAFVTPSEYRRHLNIYGEQREVAVATFEMAGIADGIDVSDDDILAHYDARPDGFRSEESVDIEFIEIGRDILAVEAEISDEDLHPHATDPPHPQPTQ